MTRSLAVAAFVLQVALAPLARAQSSDSATSGLVVAPPKKRLALEGLAFGGLVTGLTFAAFDADDGATATLAAIGAGVGLGVGALSGRSRGPAGPRIGETVRTLGPNAVEGKLARIQDGAIVVSLAEGGERVVSVDSAPVEIRRGTRLTKVGAVTGVIVLAGLAGLISVAFCETDDCSSDTARVMALGGLLGGAAGAATGSLVKVYDWRPVTRAATAAASDQNPKRRLRFSVRPTKDRGVRGQVTLAWR